MYQSKVQQKDEWKGRKRGLVAFELKKDEGHCRDRTGHPLGQIENGQRNFNYDCRIPGVNNKSEISVFYFPSY